MLEDIRLSRLFHTKTNHAPYSNLFKYVKNKREFRFFGIKHEMRNVNKMTFEEVILVRKKLSAEIIKVSDVLFVLKKFYPSIIPARLFLLMRVTKFFPAYNSIIDSIRKISESESVSWSPLYVDHDFKRAGSDKLSKFGEYNIAAEIGEKYSIRPDEVFQWTYGEVFLEIARNTINADVSKAYRDIKESKIKK